MKKTQVKKYNYDESIFSDIKTEEEAYWLGFIMADGCNINNKILRIDIKDKGHLEKLSSLIYPDGDKPIQERDLGFGPIYMFSCAVVKIVGNLNNYGIVPRKSNIANLPKLNKKVYRHFIRGLFDGDGNLYYSYSHKHSPKYRGYQYSIVGSYKLIKGVQELIKEQTNIDIKFYTMKNIFRILKKGNKSIMTIMDWMYKDSTIHLDRKYKQYQEFKKYYHKL